jgi:exopolysaccharide biosynthesis WecB/TagA/CpsF family protein
VFILGGEPARAPAGRSGWIGAGGPTGLNESAAQRLPEQLGGPDPSRRRVNPFRGEAPAGARRNAGPARRLPGGRPARNESVPFQRERGDAATIAATELARRCPGLTVVGAISPPYGFDGDPAALEQIHSQVVAARPDLVLVGVGFPRQERLIASMRRDLPGAWFLGCGMAINFVAGEKPRAPAWMQRAGIEWLHRLASEPRRLTERYLRHDLPFASALLMRTVIARCRRRPRITRRNR